MYALFMSDFWRRSCGSCLRASTRTRQHRPTGRITWTHLSARQASTSANPYPFPQASHPTPHQIFHLPKSATRSDVKARYYDLVRIYHPDSPSARAGGVSPETAHSRFQAISAAYAILSGKKAASSLDGSNEPDSFGGATRTSYHDLSTAMWRARQRKRAELDIGFDERWNDRMMLGVLLLAMSLFVFQAYTTRSQALADARQARRSHPRADSDLSLDSSAPLDERRLAADAPARASDE